MTCVGFPFVLALSQSITKLKVSPSLTVFNGPTKKFSKCPSRRGVEPHPLITNVSGVTVEASPMESLLLGEVAFHVEDSLFELAVVFEDELAGLHVLSPVIDDLSFELFIS